MHGDHGSHAKPTMILVWALREALQRSVYAAVRFAPYKQTIVDVLGRFRGTNHLVARDGQLLRPYPENVLA